MNKTVALALLLCVSGCAQFHRPPDSYFVAIDPKTNDDQVEAIYNALDQWTAATGVQFQVTMTSQQCGYELTEPHSGCIYIAFATQAYVQEQVKVPGVYAVGVTVEQGCGIGGKTANGFSSNIFIAEDVNLLTWDIRHEIGHAIGLSHEAGTVMDPYIDREPKWITCRDMQQYQEVRSEVVTTCSFDEITTTPPK